MPAAVRLKPGSLKDPEVAQLFSTKDPEQRYCDLREVGSGSFGSVYYAQDKENNETVAIKKMNFNGKDAQEKWLDIIKEVRFLRSIRHKNIVEYRACFIKEYTCWMVMEYCIGSASDIIGVFKDQLVEDAIAEICEQTLEALQYIHGFKYIHRDVKAGNILITDDGVVKLGDVGSASMHSPANSFVGSPYWMAPEVILAMEEGEYGTQADLWSFGITVIELADRRPPLYDLNTMSALYHIAQNDPPTLSGTHPVYKEVLRSLEMIDFVQKCLKKEPNDRMTAAQCKEHSFIKRPRNKRIMSKLVRHTKKRVLKLDSDMYTKMKKIFYLEGANSGAAGTLSDDESDPEESCFVSTAPKRKKQPTAPQIDDEIEVVVVPEEDETDPMLTPNPSVKRLREQNHGSMSSESESNIVINGNEAEADSENSEAKAKNRTVISVSETDDTNDTEQNGRFGSDSSANSRQIEPRDMNEEINTLRRSKFSTLRPTKVVSREIEESRRENNAKEQMHGYQRLRQYHHKEQQQLEERCKFEAEAVRQKQEKEYEQFLITAQKEMQKIRQNHQNQQEKKARENEESAKKAKKQRINANEHELKSFSQCQKREYKFNKEQAKKQFKERGLRKSSFEEAIRNTKADLMQKWTTAERQYVAEQKIHMLNELSELRHRNQSDYQGLEHKLLADEHSVRTRQLEVIEQMLLHHHKAAYDQALQHFRECAEMKKRHLKVQHESELTNQKDYTKRALDELKKQHAVRQRNLPRELKLKEQQIRKQFRHTVKVQARQYKVLQQQVQQNAPKSEQKEVVNRLKEEQNRKIAQLAVQYEENIRKMMSEQHIQMDTGQEEELNALTDKLTHEMNLLTEFQERQRVSLEASCDRELENLNSTWSKKRTALMQKIQDDRMRFERERAAQVAELEAQQERDRIRLESMEQTEREQILGLGADIQIKQTENRNSLLFQVKTAPGTPLSDRFMNSHSPAQSSCSSPSRQSTNL
ncbi:unnamed protein product [Bursaphelenchus okinawaensis]|uniref:non-specific serine/threonine protein kinase n=1 Tax=Bursaphelenchus okinawaensis TaxID=465554 RepID=A0A811KGJ6_9BILA|nr:unnamed protein product [Bursaphelenchus okinawaensis]CAG9101846.1 unnamed protein product [Bursaphelenchus okinawaensis]